jgi:hypothetical protein
MMLMVLQINYHRSHEARCWPPAERARALCFVTPITMMGSMLCFASRVLVLSLLGAAFAACVVSSLAYDVGHWLNAW